MHDQTQQHDQQTEREHIIQTQLNLNQSFIQEEQAMPRLIPENQHGNTTPQKQNGSQPQQNQHPNNIEQVATNAVDSA
jgi:hypothetical protein